MVAEKMPVDTLHLAIAFGTGKIPIHGSTQIAASLGSEKSLALPTFHALTSCDTVSALSDMVKTAWAVWSSYPNLAKCSIGTITGT